MIPFAKLAYGDIFDSRSGKWRKIFPTANTDRRGLPPWNALRLDPPTIHPNLWKQALSDARLATELNTLAASPVYGTFLDGFLVARVEDNKSTGLLEQPTAAA
jgi:hypothetical protein